MNEGSFRCETEFWDWSAATSFILRNIPLGHPCSYKLWKVKSENCEKKQYLPTRVFHVYFTHASTCFDAVLECSWEISYSFIDRCDSWVSVVSQVSSNFGQSSCCKFPCHLFCFRREVSNGGWLISSLVKMRFMGHGELLIRLTVPESTPPERDRWVECLQCTEDSVMRTCVTVHDGKSGLLQVLFVNHHRGS